MDMSKSSLMTIAIATIVSYIQIFANIIASDESWVHYFL